MAQQQWRINGYSGRSYLIGLYHGDESGHLMVHCNNNILLTDFKVNDSKDYSFYLDQEMFQLRLSKVNGQFTYELIHNEDIDSPHNRRQAENKRSDRWKLIAFVGLALFFIVLFAGMLRKNGNEQAEFTRILNNGGGSSTTIIIGERNGQLVAQYPAEGQLYNKKLFPSDTISSFGFPLLPGQQFSGRYYPEDPDVLRIEWSQPSQNVLEQYQLMTSAKHIALHPELAPPHARCQVRIAYELEGLEGLAKMYGQDRSTTYRFHEYEYLRLVRSSAFRERVRECL